MLTCLLPDFDLQVALRTLGQLVESTGYVIEPYMKHRDLLPTLLSILKTGQGVLA